MTFPTSNAVKPSGRLFCFSTTCIKNCDSVFLMKTSIRYTNNFVSSSPNSWFELLPWTFYPPDYALAAGPLEASRAREMLSMRMNGTKANKPQEVGRSCAFCSFNHILGK
ncbi:Facilitated trehalose transporter Tret1 [Trichinella pseudospiralis]